MDSGSRRERSLGAPPLLMSGESACPIIEAMLRAQIAETRDWRGIEKRQLETQPAKTFRVARYSELAEKFKHPSLLIFIYTPLCAYHQKFFLIASN